MSPDTQRFLLLGGVFAVGYLLVLAWDKDYSSAPQHPDTPTTQHDSASPTHQTPTTIDVPVIKTDPSPPATLNVTTPNFTSANQGPIGLVEVETDSYRLWLDLTGGDLVDLQLKQYPISLDNPEVPITLLQRSANHTYIVQSGLRSEAGPDWYAARPQYTTRSTHWVLDDTHDELRVPLVWRGQDGLEVTKTYIFTKNSHRIRLLFEINNQSKTNWSGNVFAQIKRDAKPPSLSTGVAFGPRAYIGAAFTTPEDRYLKIDFDDLEEQSFQASVQGGWVAMLQHYFLTAWVPPADSLNIYYGQKQSDGTYQVGFIGPTTTTTSGNQTTIELLLYVGPKLQSELSSLADNLDLTVDYGFLWWLSQPLFWLLKAIQSVVINWGVAIIILTTCIKIILYPLSAAAYRSMANMRRLAPKLKRIQERHAGDRQRLSQEMMGLYKKEKINPLGGCIPILLQMPVFLALYWVLYESVELRQAPFVFWITDLSTKDPWFVLPILMGGTMYVQQLLNPPIPDPMQARIIRMMPIIFTLFFLIFPSGLVLYWLTNNILSILQQHLANKKYEKIATSQ